MRITNANCRSYDQSNWIVHCWNPREGRAYEYYRQLDLNTANTLVKLVERKGEINLQYWNVPTKPVLLTSWQSSYGPYTIAIYFTPGKEKLTDVNDFASSLGYFGGAVEGQQNSKDGTVYSLRLNGGSNEPL